MELASSNDFQQSLKYVVIFNINIIILKNNSRDKMYVV